jgi:glutamate-ammonia-ligase adenylyltransferase
MQIDQLRGYLDDHTTAEPWLRSLGVVDTARAHANLERIATGGVTLDLLADLADQLTEHLPGSSDADMAINNLERFIAAARSPLALASLFQRDREALPTLLQIFSTSQHLSDLLIVDTEAYDLLRMTEGQPVGREALVQELSAEVLAMPDSAGVMAALRRFKRRETLRISYGDIIRGQRIDIVARQISYLADALVEAAVTAARHKLMQRRPSGQSTLPDGARFVVFALGKLGGEELNYSSDIDLMFLWDAGPNVDPARIQSYTEIFDRLAREILRLLSESTPLGVGYRVDMRLRPEGQSGGMTSSLESALHYYDTAGRTWERQAFVKARPIAGDLSLGREFLKQLEPWIYRRYLSRADISGIQALKRRIEQRTIREGADTRNVKTGHGGIRDVEFVIQFLQLLNGGDLPALRTGNTLEAIARLEQCGCLTHQERTILDENYAFLRKIEHRLQIMFDLQTHLLPCDPAELRKVAIRMGYRDEGDSPALAAFQADYAAKTELNRKILDHLLHDAFPGETKMEPEGDLVLDPQPNSEQIGGVLGKYGFANPQDAYRNLMDLANERIRFLSTRRCRHFLAAIASRLLEAIAATPNPDHTLVNLVRVSDSLGGKGVLWELFSFHPPSLRLYVELCSSSEYLASILTSNPGMLDELMDSLLLDKLPTRPVLDATLADLCRGAEDIERILHSFKDGQQLRVGVREILGKERIEAITGALSDIAETCLRQIADAECAKLIARHGEPTIAEGDRAGQRCEFAILAMGKFGGRELNYYSDLDVVFLFEADGTTAQKRSRRDNTTTNQHFFSELGQRVIKVCSQLGPYGRLYVVDPRLRPTGKNGPLATSLAEFSRYFADGQGQLWERQALCEARVVFGSPQFGSRVLEAAQTAAYLTEWRSEDFDAVRQMRARLEAAVPAGNLKRGPGGLVDIEFLVQTLQLRYGSECPSVRVPGTLAAIEALHAARLLPDEDHDFLRESFRFLRTLQARMRLWSTTARDTLPDDPRELAKLARLLEYENPEQLLHDCHYYLTENRRRFEGMIAASGAAV